MQYGKEQVNYNLVLNLAIGYGIAYVALYSTLQLSICIKTSRVVTFCNVCIVKDQTFKLKE